MEEAALDAFVSLFKVVSVSPALARAGGLLRRDYAKSHDVGLADAFVAATAQVERADFLTLNVRHHPMLKALQPAYVR